MRLFTKSKNTYIHIGECSSIAKNTQIAYTKSWQCFEKYCINHKVSSLPADEHVVKDFLIQKSSGLSSGSLELYLSSINKMHEINGYPSLNACPIVKETMRTLARRNNRSPRRVKALLNTDLVKILDLVAETKLGIRDAAILATGFSAALRRSEICALRFEDVEFIKHPSGTKMILHIRRSKTDQTGRGYRIGVPNGKNIHPVSRLKTWIESAAIDKGYLFRALKRGGGVKSTPLHHSDIPRLVKQYVAKINLNPEEYAGHSLRSGFITSAARHNARLDKIMEVSRHKSTDMVMSYIRDGGMFDNHAGKGFL